MSDYQKLFDRAFDAVIGQGCPSVDSVGGCRYRGENGNKCAIGHLLTDEQMQHHGISEGNMPEDFSPQLLSELFPTQDPYDRLDPTRFLVDLQNAHDASDRFQFDKDYRSRMSGVARKWKLKDKE